MIRSARRASAVLNAMAMLLIAVTGSGCATSPAAEDQATFVASADAATQWFQARVPGLKAQMDKSGGYVIYPSVGQWGILYLGGKFGRGAVYLSDGTQVG